MTEILVIMSVGIFFGVIIRKYKGLIYIVEKLTMWAIYLLLFLLGLSVGTNEQVIKNFGRIGLQAISLTLFGVFGSVLISFILYKFLFKDKE